MKDICSKCSNRDHLLLSGICFKCSNAQRKLENRNDTIVRALALTLMERYSYPQIEIERIFDDNGHEKHDENAIDFLVKEIQACEDSDYEAHQERLQLSRESESKF